MHRNVKCYYKYTYKSPGYTYAITVQVSTSYCTEPTSFATRPTNIIRAGNEELEFDSGEEGCAVVLNSTPVVVVKLSLPCER